MEYTFSDRVSNLKPSAIREIFKYAADPSVVSLSAGNPSPDAFPVKEIEEISARVLRENPISVLQYSVTEGYTPLRQHMMAYMQREHNTGSDSDDILITTGAQQIMDLCSKALVNEGEVVICEAPSFIGSLNTFRSYNAKLVGVTVEPEGFRDRGPGHIGVQDGHLFTGPAEGHGQKGGDHGFSHASLAADDADYFFNVTFLVGRLLEGGRILPLAAAGGAAAAVMIAICHLYIHLLFILV